MLSGVAPALPPAPERRCHGGPHRLRGVDAADRRPVDHRLHGHDAGNPLRRYRRRPRRPRARPSMRRKLSTVPKKLQRFKNNREWRQHWRQQRREWRRRWHDGAFRRVGRVGAGIPRTAAGPRGVRQRHVRPARRGGCRGRRLPGSRAGDRAARLPAVQARHRHLTWARTSPAPDPDSTLFTISRPSRRSSPRRPRHDAPRGPGSGASRRAGRELRAGVRRDRDRRHHGPPAAHAHVGPAAHAAALSGSRQHGGPATRVRCHAGRPPRAPA